MSILLSNTTSLQEILETVNNLPEASGGGEQAAPEISINSAGLITATAGTKSSTYQLAFQSAKTITPSTLDQIAVSSGHYTGGNITVKGDSNLVAENIVSGKSIFGISGTAEIGSAGSEAVEYSENEDAIISRTITSYTNDRVKVIGDEVFAYCYSLTSANFPVCTSIGSSAFYFCSSLTSVSFPMCTNIYYNAFNNCQNLKSIIFPACKSLSSNAFYNCRRLTSINFPECIYIGNNAFYSCPLISISFPICASIGENAFERCYGLISVNFPECTYIGREAFRYCYSLASISFPMCTIIRDYAFEGCTSLTSVNFPVSTKIYSNAFIKCYTLSTFILGTSSVCTLTNSNAFSSTPYAGYSASFSGTPYIYVPSSLVTAYQSATNWAYFSSYFSSIESLGVI